MAADDCTPHNTANYSKTAAQESRATVRKIVVQKNPKSVPLSLLGVVIHYLWAQVGSIWPHHRALVDASLQDLPVHALVRSYAADGTGRLERANCAFNAFRRHSNQFCKFIPRNRWIRSHSLHDLLGVFLGGLLGVFLGDAIRRHRHLRDPRRFFFSPRHVVGDYMVFSRRDIVELQCQRRLAVVIAVRDERLGPMFATPAAQNLRIAGTGLLGIADEHEHALQIPVAAVGCTSLRWANAHCARVAKLKAVRPLGDENGKLLSVFAALQIRTVIWGGTPPSLHF